MLVAHQTQADRFDGGIDARLIGWFGGHPGLGLRLAAPGSLVPAAVLTTLLVIGSLLARRLNGALLALVSVTVSIGLDERVFKPWFDRTYLGFLSYPSGHTTAVFALAATVTVLLLVTPQPGRRRVLRMVVVAASCLVGGAVAAAVIGLRWHYFTDTVAGAAVGIGTVCGVAMLLDLPQVRRLSPNEVRRGMPDWTGYRRGPMVTPATVAPTHLGRQSCRMSSTSWTFRRSVWSPRRSRTPWPD
ncbi:MAG: phosphatase PAP2 family protein [Oryzihumus sp.]